MAEAMNTMEVEMADCSTVSSTYFCHHCALEIDSEMPGLTCPLCESGCVEELTENLRRDRATENNSERLFMDLLSTRRPTVPPPASRHNRDAFEDDDDDDGDFWPRSRYNISSRRRSERSDRNAPLHFFIESILDSVRVDSYRRFVSEISDSRLRRDNNGSGGDLRRNHGGGPFNRQGLEDMLTQILTQLMSPEPEPEPEPATQDQIDALPVLTVKEILLENLVRCSICLENFIDDDEVTSLSCNHLHHRRCIGPWLQLHPTCPVCRHVLHSTSPRNRGTGASSRSTERSEDTLVAYEISIFEHLLQDDDLRTRLAPRQQRLRPFADVTASSAGITSPSSFTDVETVRMHNDNVLTDVNLDDVVTDINLDDVMTDVNLNRNDFARDDERRTGRRDDDKRHQEMRDAVLSSMSEPEYPETVPTSVRDVEVTGLLVGDRERSVTETSTIDHRK